MGDAAPHRCRRHRVDHLSREVALLPRTQPFEQFRPESVVGRVEPLQFFRAKTQQGSPERVLIRKLVQTDVNQSIVDAPPKRRRAKTCRKDAAGGRVMASGFPLPRITHETLVSRA